MVLAVDASDTDKVIEALKTTGDKAYVIGEVISGNGNVELV